MPKIDDLANSLGNLGSQIDQTVSTAAAAAQQSEEAASMADALGASRSAERLDQVRDELDDLAALLKGASAQAGAIQALALSARTGGGGGMLNVPAAQLDPAAVPSNRRDRKRRGFSNAMGQAAKKTEDVQDFVETMTESYQDISDAVSHKTIRPPTPPEATSTATAEAASPATGSASTSGVEAPTLAGAVMAVGTAVVAAREVGRRWRRAWRTPEQFPEGEGPSPANR